MLGRLYQKDVGAGLICVLVAIVGFVANGPNEIGAARDMGPGYFPLIVFGLLLVSGVAMIVVRLARPGEAPEPFAWRPVLAVTAAILLFALLVEHLGFILSAILMFVVGCFAHGRLSVVQVAVLSVAGAAGAAGLFVGLLHLPIPIWPAF